MAADETPADTAFPTEAQLAAALGPNLARGIVTAVDDAYLARLAVAAGR